MPINFIHFLKVFEVILAFIRASGILFFLALKIKFGQISESTKKITFGSHKNKNLSTWTKWVKYTILHWFTLGLITVLQPLNYLGFDIVLKRIIPKSLLSFQEYFRMRDLRVKQQIGVLQQLQVLSSG